MNPVERILNDEVARLLDRLAASVPPGCLRATAAESSALRRRLDEVEGQMAVVRASLLGGYGRWGRLLEDVENLWALAAWRAGAPEASPADAESTPEVPEEAHSLAA